MTREAEERRFWIAVVVCDEQDGQRTDRAEGRTRENRPLGRCTERS